MKTLLVLGGGTGGTIVANKMARRLDAREWQVIVIDRDERHLYQPGLLFIPFGMYQPRDIIKPKRRLLATNVKVIFDEVESIEPEKNQVKVTEQHEAIVYDELVIALGCEIAPEETPGLKGPAWRKNIFDFYTLDGAAALAGRLRDWPGGRLVVNVAEMPIKCPVAPLEFLFLADWFFEQRGIRNKVELIYATPLAGAFTKPKATAALRELLARKNIQVVPDFALCEVDNNRSRLLSYDKKEVEFDLLVTIPVNKGDDVVGQSGLGDELNYVETNPQTLQSRKWPNVWAIGDAADVHTAKAGSVAHFMADTLVENLQAHIENKPLTEEFDGHANCFIESGYHRALLIDYSYSAEPVPGPFPLPLIGPFPMLKESVINHWGKLAFRWIYWNQLLPGRLPFPSKYRAPAT
jgi:sulfide:quinone oxidoreductase